MSRRRRAHIVFLTARVKCWQDAAEMLDKEVSGSHLKGAAMLWQEAKYGLAKLSVWVVFLTPDPVPCPELSSCPVCSTPFQKPQAETEQTSGGSEDCEAPRGTCGRAGRTCQPSQSRPSSLPMNGLCWGKVRTQRSSEDAYASAYFAANFNQCTSIWRFKNKANTIRSDWVLVIITMRSLLLNSWVPQTCGHLWTNSRCGQRETGQRRARHFWTSK